MGEEKKACIGCGGTLSALASICAECGSYQTAWKNSLRFWANVSTVLAVGITAIGFLASIVPEIRRALLPREVVGVAYLNSRAHVVLANRSDYPVFVAYVELRAVAAKLGRSFYLTVNEVMQPGGFHTVKIPQREELAALTMYDVDDPEREGERRLTREQRARLVDDFDCYRVVYYDAVALEDYRRLIDALPPSPLEAYALIAFRPSNRDEMIRQTVSVRTLGWRSSAGECRQKYGDYSHPLHTFFGKN